MTLPRLSTRRTIAITAWLTGFIANAASSGMPTKRSNVLVWVTLAIVALGIDRPRRTLRSFLTTWLPLFGTLAAYDLLRGISDDRVATAHTWPQLDFDRWLGFGTTPTVRLQHLLWTPGDPHWWDYAVWGVYQTHFLLPLMLAVVLWSMRHRLAVPYIVGIATLSWLALATYALFPAQPPWMVAQSGMTGDIARVVHHMWQDVGVDRAARVFTTNAVDGSHYSNPVAALPSLHAAFPMFIAVMLWGMHRRLNVLLAAYAAAMGFALVYAGEHFVFDVLMGWTYAVTVAVGAKSYSSLVPRMRSSRREPQAAFEGAGGSAGLVGALSRSRYTSLPHTDKTRS